MSKFVVNIKSPKLKSGDGGGGGGVAGSSNTPKPSNYANSHHIRCKYCNRTFVPGRIEYHESVCLLRSYRPPPIPYDSRKARVSGTPAEFYLGRNFYLANGSYHALYDSKKFLRKFSSSPLVKNILESSKSGNWLIDDGKKEMECPLCLRSFKTSAALVHIPYCKNYKNQSKK